MISDLLLSPMSRLALHSSLSNILSIISYYFAESRNFNFCQTKISKRLSSYLHKNSVPRRYYGKCHEERFMLLPVIDKYLRKGDSYE